MNRLETLWTELCARTDYENCSRPRAARFRLDTMEGLVERLDDVHRSLPALHVAGSKGKGSVCHFLARGLTASGLKVGLYASPHLSDWRERLTIDGAFASDAALADALQKVLAASAGEETFFDLLTAAAMVLFRDAGCDIMVLETGLGGRSDSTNVVQPMAAVVTSIELEHVDVLGPDLASIAGEKAGIYKPDALLFAGAGIAAEAMKILESCAGQQGGALHVAPSRLPGRSHVLPHQDANLALAVTVLRDLPRPFAAAADILLSLPETSLQLPGRWERRKLADGRLVVFDIAHSTASLTAVLQAFRKAFPDDLRGVLFALRDDKDPMELGAQLHASLGPRAETESWWAMPAGDHPRSAAPATIAPSFDAVPLPNPQFPDGPEVFLVTGSTYLVGALRPETEAWSS